MKRWRQSQQETAKLLDGKEQPASGARPAYKGDVVAEGVLCEDKYTNKSFIVLQQSWFTKIRQEAVYRGVTPMLTFRIARYGKWQMVPIQRTEDGAIIVITGRSKKISAAWLEEVGYPVFVMVGGRWEGEWSRWMLTKIQ